MVLTNPQRKAIITLVEHDGVMRHRDLNKMTLKALKKQGLVIIKVAVGNVELTGLGKQIYIDLKNGSYDEKIELTDPQKILLLTLIELLQTNIDMTQYNMNTISALIKRKMLTGTTERVWITEAGFIKADEIREDLENDAT